MLPVVIGTHPDRKPWLEDCLKSIRATSSGRRTVHIHHHGGYEPAAILAGCQRFDRFLFLQDSVTILHPDFWKVVDESGPAWLAGPPHMFLGIYNSADVAPLLPTHELTKSDAIHWENHLPALLTMPVIWPDITDATGRFEERHGRNNLILENGMLRKFKGHWGQGGPDL